MKSFSKMRRQLGDLLLSVLSGIGIASAGQGDRVAVAKSDSLAVHPRMSTTAPIVKALQKGERVVIEMEILSAGQSWCFIREVGQAKGAGYVLCQSLERVAIPEGATTLAATPGSSPPVSESTLQPRVSVKTRISGLTPLHFAAMQGHTETAKRLIQAGAPLIARSVGDFKNSTPLMLAAMASRHAIVTLLVEAGADVNASAGHCGTALVCALGAENGAETVDILLRAGARLNPRPMFGVTELMIAASQDRAATVQRLLEAGAKVNQEDIWGVTALMKAADYLGRENTAAVKVLLAGGANVNLKDRCDQSALIEGRTAGRTALMKAAGKCKTEIVRLLLAAGTDVSLRDNHGETALDWAGGMETYDLLKKAGARARPDHPRPTWSCRPATKLPEVINVGTAAPATPPSEKQSVAPEELRPLKLESLVDKRDIATLKALLAQGADVKGPDGGSALIRAVMEGNIEATRLLLSAGADPNFEYFKLFVGFRPLDFAETEGIRDPALRKTLREILKAAGAQHSAFWETGKLVGAACEGRTAEVRRLLAAGADVNAAGPDGTTALMQAAHCSVWLHGHTENTETVKLLLAAGADANAHNSRGDTALQQASGGTCAPNIVRLLLAAGARVNDRNRIGKTMLSESVGKCGELLMKAGGHF